MPRSPFTALILAAALIAPVPAWPNDNDIGTINSYRTPEYSGPNARLDNDQRPNSLIRRDPLTRKLEYDDNNPLQQRNDQIRARILEQNKRRLEQQQRAQYERFKTNQ